MRLCCPRKNLKYWQFSCEWQDLTSHFSIFDVEQCLLTFGIILWTKLTERPITGLLSPKKSKILAISVTLTGFNVTFFSIRCWTTPPYVYIVIRTELTECFIAGCCLKKNCILQNVDNFNYYFPNWSLSTLDVLMFFYIA